MPEPKAEFFITTNYPHRWSSGPVLRHFDDEYKPFESLEEAREYAAAKQVVSYDDNACYTTYGVQYDTERG